MLKNLKIQNKLLVLISVLLVLTTLIGLEGMKVNNQANEVLKDLYYNRIECFGQLQDVRDGYAINIMGMTRKLVNHQVSYEEALQSFDEGKAKIDSQWKAYIATYAVADEEALSNELTQKMAAADVNLNYLRDLIKNKKLDKINDFSQTKLSETIDPLIKDVAKLALIQIRESKIIFDSQEIKSQKSKNFLIAVICIAIFLGCFLGYKIVKMITIPLEIASTSINKMAQGDLNFELETEESKDEIGDIIRSTKAITKTLKNVDADLKDQIQAIRDGSLSTRVDASQHPGSFGEIVSGVNELMETVSAPMNEIASVMAKLASGDIRGRVNGEYAGEIKALKGNVNRSLDALVALLDSIGEFAASLAKGDIRHRVEGNFQGEFASIKQNLNSALDQLNSVLREVVLSTHEVSASAMQTSAASKTVLEHTQKQSSHLTDVTTAIEQTGAAIFEIAKSTARGSSLAQDAALAAENGQTTLRSLITSVHSIAEKNKKITQISELIADIADKTYVLALNAGLEAVRAGDHGAGFGLIAAKITTLAEEVANATRSIKELIIEASDSVNQGVETANVAHTSIAQIVELSRQNGTNVQGIATSVEEQNAMMQMVKERVLNLQQLGQTTSTVAEDISLTMQKLVQIAQNLKKETDVLKTSS
jgi:methyl-accepting chemotaxis protein